LAHKTQPLLLLTLLAGSCCASLLRLCEQQHWEAAQLVEQKLCKQGYIV
jgi:hypothetical protein